MTDLPFPEVPMTSEWYCSSLLVNIASLCVYSLVNLLAMNLYVFRGINADPYLVAVNPENGNFYIVTNHQRFAYTACQNQHAITPLAQ
tara:strand:- start:6426 stop:6689 length:264 start_codon:yes stop_codon:yes gene_type:complete